jgi:hypothetical protein
MTGSHPQRREEFDMSVQIPVLQGRGMTMSDQPARRFLYGAPET